jgi:hypothetical protein
MSPCTHCGAINRADALACFMCGSELSPRTTDADAWLMPAVPGRHPEPAADAAHAAPDPIVAMEASCVGNEAVSDEPPNDGLGPREPEQPIPETSPAIAHLVDALPASTELELVRVSAPSYGPGSTRPSRMTPLLAAASAAVMAAVLYMVLGPKPVVEPSAPLSASHATGGLENINERRGAGKQNGGTIDPKRPASIAGSAEAASTGVGVQAVPAPAQGVVADVAPPGAAAAPAPVVPATPRPRGATRERKPVSQAPAPMAEVLTRPKATNPAPVPQRNPAGLGPCTDAVAALGLCTSESTQRRP